MIQCNFVEQNRLFNSWCDKNYAAHVEFNPGWNSHADAVSVCKIG